MLGFFSGLEQAIRHLLSGAVVVALWLLSRYEPLGVVSWAERNQLMAAVAVIIVGMTAYTAYRIIFWNIADRLAWQFGSSAPALHPADRYSIAYAWFLRWRQSDKLAEPVSRYLWYRWASAHFTLVLGVALVLAACFKDEGSFVASYPCRTALLGLLAVIFGVWQCVFLFGVEWALQQAEEKPPHKDVAIEAYYLWESEGRPEGRSMEYWSRAEERLRWRGRPDAVRGGVQAQSPPSGTGQGAGTAEPLSWPTDLRKNEPPGTT
ncbi:MAG: hypothetical protein JWO38_1149 [Gemmataceae bacterium]|nr:hypothetical protein [Gemmataceae bacterium]